MNYQVGGNNQSDAMFGNTGIVGNNGMVGKSSHTGSSILSQNSVGDLLACKLVKNGKEPILDINGIQLKTRASKELDSAKVGDTIYMKIQQADKNQVSLKIVGVGSMGAESAELAGSAGQTDALLGMDVSTEELDAATVAQIMQNTEQVSDMIKENLDGALDEKEAKENQKEILRNISPEEIAKLRMMQIDVTNATLSDLLGMVITIRSNEHQDEINEVLSNIVESTLSDLKENIAPDTQGPEELVGTQEPAEEEAPVMTSNLNSEGYVVTRPVKPTTAKTRKGMTGYGVEPNGANGHAEAANGSDAARKDTKTDGANGQKGSDKQNKKNAPVDIKEEKMIYMIKNGMDLTIENIYTAKNSVNESSPSQIVPFNEQVWNDIYPQVTGIIEAAGITVNDQSLNGAKFMLTHELPITVDSLRLYMSVHALNQRGFSEAQARENIAEQVAGGNPPEQARISGSTVHERAQQLMEKVQGISDQTVDSAVAQGKPLTIAYLYNHALRSIDVRKLQNPVNTGVEGASLSLSGATEKSVMTGQSGSPLSMNPAAIAARRQMEEIRLSMTLEAAVRLVRMDFNIDAKPLSNIVDSLRQEENNYYDKVVSSHDLHDIPEDVDLLKETLKETDDLKNLPAYALGEMVKRPAITVGELHISASRTKVMLAGNAYETMMTKPRQDMGDSITEAFQNVDAILEDLELDRNMQNQRAVRILAFNQMELTKTNIVSVKEADAKVQQMFETLTPQIVLNLIREKKNPLNMTVDGLNEEIMQQREIRGITDEQKFSEFLFQMDRNNTITEEERTSFIGIYRLLDKVEKSHGKDIGAVVRNGQEVTLNNLFAADKSRKARGINVGIDDNFGERVNVETSANGILNQINTAYNQTLTGSILRHIKPETLKSLETLDYQDMSFEELNNLIKAGDNGMGETELLEDISNTLKEALSYEEEVATMLDANDLPKTITNMIAAHQVMFGEDGIYGMAREIKKNLSKERREQITEQEESILDNMESKADVVYGMENLRSSLSEAVHDKEMDGTITAMDIQALKYLNAGMPIAMRAVEQDTFRIPLVVEGSVSIMKVSVVHDGSKAGEISATMQTQKYGQLEAFIRAEGNQVEGYITMEEEDGQTALEMNELTIRSVFAKAGIEVKDLRLDGTKPMLYGSRSEEEMPTAKLYKVAKQLLTAIKLTGVAADN
ncbi:MAG: hypothetical protein K2L07_03805 [Lachnospiraceae bacterium]|nr:hypothetical protein [Lachnospiraceae bacterium]